MATRRVTTAIEQELSSEDYMYVELFGETYKLRKKFKRLKFLRLLSSDPGAALALVFAEGEFERLEEVDMDDQGFNEVLERVSSVLTGGPKN